MKRMKYLAINLITGLLAVGFFFSAAVANEVSIGFTGPLSGPGAGYGRDNANGLRMAIHDINEQGGITVNGTNYKLQLRAFDDMIDPTMAVNNARRMRSRHNTVVIYNPVFNTIAPLMQINEERGSEFLMMAYSSTPAIDKMDNKLTASIPPPFTAYVKAFSDIAWEKGWRKGGMLVTLGAYGDEWREDFRNYWTNEMGGEIVADRPANYYTDTDFSSQLSSILNANPDFMLIGGPSEPTGLVMEQARGLGFKGGFILVDQAKMDYIANTMFGGDLSLMDNTIGICRVLDVPSPVIEDFNARYTEMFDEHNTFEAMLNYSSLWLIASAMEKAGSVDDPHAIKAAISEVVPQDSELVPTAFVGTRDVKLLVAATVGYIEGGEYQRPSQYVWWAKDEEEFKEYEAMLPAGDIENRWTPVTGYLE